MRGLLSWLRERVSLGHTQVVLPGTSHQGRLIMLAKSAVQSVRHSAPPENILEPLVLGAQWPSRRLSMVVLPGPGMEAAHSWCGSVDPTQSARSSSLGP